MKRISLVAVALAGVTFSLASASSPDDSASPLVAQAIAAPSTLSYTGVVETVEFGSHAAQASVYRIEHRAPNLTRKTYTSPSDEAGDCVITKGDLRVAFDPKQHRAVESVNTIADDRLAVAGNAALLRENYRAVAQSTLAFDGRPASEVLLINNYTRRTTLRLLIDRSTKLVLDEQEYADDGSLRREVRFESVEYAAVAASEFDLPKGYSLDRTSTQSPAEDPKRAMSSAGFAVRAPGELPDGFAPVEGDLGNPQGVRTLHLLYSDGVRTLSIFESVTAAAPDMTKLRPQPASVDGRYAEYAEDGAVALLVWSDGTLHYTLVGEPGRSALQRFAQVISP